MFAGNNPVIALQNWQELLFLCIQQVASTILKPTQKVILFSSAKSDLSALTIRLKLKHIVVFILQLCFK